MGDRDASCRHPCHCHPIARDVSFPCRFLRFMAKRSRRPKSSGGDNTPDASPFDANFDVNADGEAPKAGSRSGCLTSLGCLATLVGAGGAIAIAAAGGIALAQWLPGASNERPPLVALLGSGDPLKPLRDRFPELPLPSPEPGTAANAPGSGEASSNDEANGSANGETLPPPTPIKLPPERRTELETQLQAIRQDLDAAGDRTSAIETRLGMPRTDAPLDTRLQRIAQRLNPTVVPKPVGDGDHPSKSITIVLPSDRLFRDGYSILRPEAGTILDTLLAELQGHRGATIRTIAHTDTPGDPTINRELSLRRARAIAQYLSRRLEGQYRWVAVGMGESQPVANGDDEANQQRNRRIEIQVDSP